MRYLFYFTFSLFTLLSSAQEIKVGDFKSQPLDIAAIEKQVLDVNNQPCALIKVRTGLSNVSFFSNLAIEKTEHHTGEYWVWVSPGTTQLRIAVQDFPLLDYKLPQMAEGKNVYIILLIATFPEKIIYRDTASIQPHVSFVTDPPGADVYINDLFYGITPLKASPPDTAFKYRIEKKRYLPVSGTDTIVNRFADISVALMQDFKAKRYFLTLDYGFNLHLVRELSGNKYYPQILGLTIGKIGKTGYYLNAVIPLKSIKPDLEYIKESDTWLPLRNTTGYYYTSTGVITYSDRDHFNLLKINGGITLQLFKRAFLSLGVGYSQSKYFKVFVKEPYDINLSGSETTTPLASGTAYGLILDQSFRGADMEMGIKCRIKNSLMLTVNYAVNIKFRNFAESDKYGGLYKNTELNPEFLSPDLKLGIGYIF